MSVDPLRKKYPELTPYQFSSNRNIDGIDKDGLEYSPATVNTERQNASESTSTISKPYPPHVQIRQAIEKAKRKYFEFMTQGYTQLQLGKAKNQKTNMKRRTYDKLGTILIVQ